ncbi:MAG: hypothetical protein KDB02_03355, partial [Acidimicrobiales bacterium]|nr:hypothetical protein [Acidimicrobiales bacterium]
EQVPPMVSAVKVGGRRLHELAREGIEVERAPRPVTIHSLSILPGPPGEQEVFTMAVECSSGTYVRTLAADIGHALGGGAHIRHLRRNAVGPFTLSDAIQLEQVDADRVRPMLDAVRHLTRLDVDAKGAADVAVGKVLQRMAVGLGDDDPGPWAVVGEGDRLLAVYEPFRDGTIKPSLVIPPDPAAGLPA